VTGDASASSEGSTSAPAEVPPEVVQAAQQRGLGYLLSTRYLANPFVVGIGSIAAGAAFFGLLYLISAFAHDKSGIIYSVMRFFALFACFAMVGSITYGIAALVRGSHAFWVYTEGIVHRHNKRVQAYTWNEVAELRGVVGTKGDNTGKLLHYRLTPQGGKAFNIPLNIVDGRDEFLDHLLAAMKQHGRPVV
jgi:hypothetical protein